MIVEQLPSLVEERAIGGAHQAVVANLGEALRQDVLEEAADEFFGGDLRGLDLISRRILVLKSNESVLEAKDAVIADGHSKDVRGKILERLEAAADRFGVARTAHPYLHNNPRAPAQ